MCFLIQHIARLPTVGRNAVERIAFNKSFPTTQNLECQMPQKKKLNGIPHDLVKSYFATDKYCVCGYMADWLLYAAKQLNIKEITIDIINKTHIPSELNFHPFTYELPFLKVMIEKALINNGFDKDYITEAKIKIIVRQESKELVCYPYLIDKNNNRYDTEPLTELSTSEEFNPFTM